MARPNNDDIDLYELLNRADELLEEKEKPELTDDFVPEFEESMETDADFIYRNAANGYGRQNPNSGQTNRFSYHVGIDKISFELLQYDNENNEPKRFYRAFDKNEQGAYRRSNICA